ncbi:MAG: GNAT family N-acetyltransferase [Candidatus Hydrogenedens sp.]
MIKKTYATIRNADRFDAKELLRFYLHKPIFATLLDTKREPLMPNLSELEELLQHKDTAQSFYAVENKIGDISGFVILKGINAEALFGEMMLLFENETYDNESALIGEALEFIEVRAFQQLHLRKLMTTCLDVEERLRNFLLNHSYQCEGCMREVLFTCGKWHNLETWAKFQNSNTLSVELK